MRRVKLALAATAALVLASCGGSVMLTQDTKPEIKPVGDKATLVIYRGTAFGFAVKIDNYLDKKFIGQTQGRSFFITRVDPGEHYVIADAENKACAKTNFEAGKIYYLMQGIYPGVMKARTGFSGADPEAFTKDLEDMSYGTINPEEEAPTIDEDDYSETIADYEKEIKEDPEKHKDTSNLQGY